MGDPTGMEALAAFLTARYDETEADITRWSGGEPHPGEPHTNDLEGDPAGKHYTMYDDTCERCLVVARLSRKVNPYAVHSFGLADLAAKRRVLAEVQSWTHYYNDSDPYFSCSQAVGHWRDDSELGSGCADEARQGKPCDCGLDRRRLAILAPLASPFAGHPEFQETWRLT